MMMSLVAVVGLARGAVSPMGASLESLALASHSHRHPTRATMAINAGCTTAEDCSLNGECSGGTCVCYAPWSTGEGDEVGCGRLNELPGPRIGMCVTMRMHKSITYQ
jgi:hypothetical protein